jgi:hypothetical protein
MWQASLLLDSDCMQKKMATFHFVAVKWCIELFRSLAVPFSVSLTSCSICFTYLALLQRYMCNMVREKSLLHAQMSLSYCYVIHISYRLSPAFLSADPSLLPATNLTKLFPLISFLPNKDPFSNSSSHCHALLWQPSCLCFLISFLRILYQLKKV